MLFLDDFSYMYHVVVRKSNCLLHCLTLYGISSIIFLSIICAPAGISNVYFRIRDGIPIPPIQMYIVHSLATRLAKIIFFFCVGIMMEVAYTLDSQ